MCNNLNVLNATGGLPWWFNSKEFAYNAGHAGSTSGSGRPALEGNGNYSNILAWEIPWTEEPGGLWSIGLQKSGTITKTNATGLCF